MFLRCVKLVKETAGELNGQSLTETLQGNSTNILEEAL